MGKLTAKLAQFGLLGLLLLAAGGQVQKPVASAESIGLLSLPSRSVQTTTESPEPQLFGGAARTKSLPKSDWTYALTPNPGVLVRPDSSTQLFSGFTTGIFQARPYAHSGRAPPAA